MYTSTKHVSDAQTGNSYDIYYLAIIALMGAGFGIYTISDQLPFNMSLLAYMALFLLVPMMLALSLFNRVTSVRRKLQIELAVEEEQRLTEADGELIAKALQDRKPGKKK